MKFEKISIGVDIEDVDRFKELQIDKDKLFLETIFTNKELDYCFSDIRFDEHLAVRYCAKEATIKALSGFCIDYIKYNEIEILNSSSGQPNLVVKSLPNIKAKVSLSHTKTQAIAYVILINTL